MRVPQTHRSRCRKRTEADLRNRALSKERRWAHGDGSRASDGGTTGLDLAWTACQDRCRSARSAAERRRYASEAFDPSFEGARWLNGHAGGCVRARSRPAFGIEVEGRGWGACPVRLLVNEEIAPTRMRVLLGQPQGEPVQPEGGAAFIVVLDDTGGRDRDRSKRPPDGLCGNRAGWPWKSVSGVFSPSISPGAALAAGGGLFGRQAGARARHLTRSTPGVGTASAAHSEGSTHHGGTRTSCT